MSIRRIPGLALLATVLLVVLTSCGNLETTLIYEKIDARRSTIVSEEFEQVSILSLTFPDRQMQRVSMATARMLYTGEQTRSHQTGVNFDNGAVTTYESYVKDGYTYFIEDGNRYRVPLSQGTEAVAARIAEARSDGAFRSIAVEDTPEGGKRMEFRLNTVSLDDVLSAAVPEYLAFLELDIAHCLVQELYYTVEVDADDLVQRQSADASLQLVLGDGTAVDVNYTLDVLLTGINTLDRIDFPADLATFPDLTSV